MYAPFRRSAGRTVHCCGSDRSPESPCTLRLYDDSTRRGNNPRFAASHAGLLVERGAPIDAGSTAGLLPQGQLSDDHAAVGGLAHVVDREGGDRAGMQRFHLHTSAVDRVDVGLDGDEVVADLEVHRHRTDEQRMAERDRVGGALGGLDGGDPGDREHVALVHLAVGDRRCRLRLHRHLAARHGPPMGRFLGSDVDHARPAERIEMGEVGHNRQSRAWRTAERVSTASA